MKPTTLVQGLIACMFLIGQHFIFAQESYIHAPGLALPENGKDNLTSHQSYIQSLKNNNYIAKDKTVGDPDKSRNLLLVPSGYSTIQLAINAAGIGDTVLVSPGVYYENINFNGKPLMVASQYLFSGDSSQIIQTIIDGSDAGPVATFSSNESANSFLVGFTLRNGNATAGGGVLCLNSDPVLSNLIIKSNDADYGAGIYLNESDAYIWRVAFVDNHAASYGGAVSCDNYSYPGIYNVIMTNNAAQFGGAVHCYYSSPYISEFEISDNGASYGAGIYLYGSLPYIWDGKIIDNSSTYYGGGVECDYYSEACLTYLQINGNTADYGAGIHLSYSNAVVINSTISDNTVVTNGGGIYCYNASPVLKNNIVAFNSGQYGIYVLDGVPEISYSGFWQNQSGNFYNCGDEIGNNVILNNNSDSCDMFYNIQMDPLFEDLGNQNFHLLPGSPCIDAGDPLSPEDIDNSIADIGKYYYHQTFVAAFSASPVYGLPPLMVQFADRSSGNPNQWEWDFNNDGIIDSYQKNPVWTYSEMGMYSVKLLIKRSYNSDTRLKEGFIKVYFIENPSITNIQDIPEDQGGWVTVNFLRSVYDTDTLADRGTESYTVQYNIGDGWVSANFAAAYGVDNYTILCHTPFDSTAYGTGIIDFRVIASMDEGSFVSLTETGYSVDNLVPQVPEGLAVDIIDNVFNLSWEPVSAPDLQYYAIFKTQLGVPFPPDPKYFSAEPFLNTIQIGDLPEVYAVRAVDFSGNQSFLSGPIDAPMQFLVSLSEGWNSLSGYVVPHQPQLDSLFLPIIDQVVFLQDNAGFWYPVHQQNTLGQWDTYQGYMIKMSGQGDLIFTGIIERDKAVMLQQGWNLVPVLSSCDVSIFDIQNILGNNLKAIKEVAGTNVFWPGKQISTLGQFNPGKAYLIYMYSAMLFEFPDCE